MPGNVTGESRRGPSPRANSRPERAFRGDSGENSRTDYFVAFLKNDRAHVQPASWSLAGILAFSKGPSPNRLSNGDRGRAIVSNPDFSQPLRRIQERWGIGRRTQFFKI